MEHEIKIETGAPRRDVKRRLMMVSHTGRFEMKSIITVVAIVLAVSAAHAQSLRERALQVAPEAQQWTAAQWREFDRAARCAQRRTNRLRAAGDPRAVRIARETQRRGGGWEAAASLRNTSDFRSVEQSNRQACR
jgi:hypothetical protein